MHESMNGPMNESPPNPLESLSGVICRINPIDVKVFTDRIFHPIKASIHDCITQIMVMGSPIFLFLNKNDNIYERMMALPIIQYDERNPDSYISDFIFFGSPIFIWGEIITIELNKPCKISIHRYAIHKFIFIVLVD